MANEIQSAFNAVWADGPLGTPTQPQKSEIRGIVGATIQQQVDAVRAIAATSLQWKTPVTLATTANITLSGEQTIDVVLTSSTDVLVKDHATGGLRGIYTSNAGAWTRRSDANEAAEIVGMAVFVRSGTANGGKQYICTTPAPIVVGTTALTFSEISDQSALNASIADKADKAEVDEINRRPLPSEVFSNRYAAVLAADDNNRVHAGLLHDGSFHPLEAPAHTPFIAYVTGSSPSRKVVVEREDGATFEVAGGFEGDAYNAAMAGTKCRYYVNRGGRIYLEHQEMEPTGGFDPDVNVITHIVTHGQSLSVGAYSGALLNALPPFPARAIMFKSGIRTMDLDHSPVYRNRRQDVSLLDHFTDAYEKTAGNYGETGWARMAAAVLSGSNALSSANAVLVSAHGIGASSYANLKKGTVPYINLLVGVRRAYNAARLMGMSYRLPAVVYIQGEGNAASATAAGYQASLEELQNDLDTDIKAITGQSETVKLIIDQLSSWTRSGVATSGVPIGQVNAAKANPTKIFIVGPGYALAYTTDGQHRTAIGYARRGEEVARAWRPIQAGVGYSPLRVNAAVRSVATITVSTTGGTGNLAIDTAQVPAKANSGVELFQTGGTPVTITNVAVSGTDIVVTLSGDPGGAATLQLGFGYTGTIGAAAGTANAPLTNIRDSSADGSLYGGPLQKWLCHDLVNVT